MKRNLRLYILWMLIISTLVSCSGTIPQTPTNTFPAPTATLENLPVFPDSPGPVKATALEEMDSFIIKAIEVSGVPGAAVAIVQDGKVIYAKGFGVRAIGQPELVNQDTLMMIGSTSKSMTTLMMATLVDEGKITWDTPVTSVYPSFALSDPEVTRKVTIHHLVCACTGIPRYDLPMVFHPVDEKPEDMIASLARIPVKPDFDKTYNYNNQIVAAGGYISAIAAGNINNDLEEAYQSTMKARVFDPIGMKNTTTSTAAVHANGNFALPHAYGLDATYTSYPIETELAFLTNLTPAGGIWSSANDMARYLATQMNKGLTPESRRVVSSENLTFTWEPQVDMGDGGSYGLGLMSFKYNGLPLIEHGGNTEGFTTSFSFLPTAGIGIVVLSNGGWANNFTQTIRDGFFRLAFGNSLSKSLAFRSAGNAGKMINDLKKNVLPETDLKLIAPYYGHYYNESWGDIRLFEEGGNVMIDFGEVALDARQVKSSGPPAIMSVHPALLASAIPLVLDKDETGRLVVVMPASFGDIVFVLQE